MSPFETGLDRSAANFAALTPVSFLGRAADAFADRVAVIDGARRLTYRELDARCRRLAAALKGRGIGRLDTVAILSGNVPAMIEAHFAVPMLGAVLNPLNTRLDAATLSASLAHGGARALIVDAPFRALAAEALRALPEPILTIAVDDPESDAPSYDDLLAEGDPDFIGPGPDDEWQSLCLLYTSGTTGDPKGAVQPSGSRPTASISGRCRCSIAAAGPTPGRWWRPAARRSAYARSSRPRSTRRSPSTASRICPARRSCCR